MVSPTKVRMLINPTYLAQKTRSCKSTNPAGIHTTHHFYTQLATGTRLGDEC